jgi:hypothetical protein
VSASFGNEPLQEVMESLALSLDARLEQHGQTMRLMARR